MNQVLKLIVLTPGLPMKPYEDSFCKNISSVMIVRAVIMLTM